MAKPELGTKRLCAGCGAKFYDLNKSPIVCPKCATVYEVAPPPRGRSDARAATPEPEEALETPEVETVSLEEADAESNTGKVVAGTPETEDDIEVDETLDDDDDSTFIPDDEEEGGDDVTDIIGERPDDDET